ncbi:MAG: OmpA family protein [candidate division KSB1 bacterium]|nr:OmpA family protein [candidate division KSB1 bacterium]MDZ7303907.1 OmpA family protein [candidate division KSB1 bacterium]MDZ7313068.1 OmpA family protein [candidate division KSB1 bacterium]
MKKIVVVLLSVALLAMSIGCSSWSRKEKGAAIGAGTGAVVGGAIGKAAGNTILGAILGAAVGGAAGAYIGNYMDKQAAEMQQDLKGAKVERVGEGIKITFDSGLLFDVDQAALKPQSKENLQKLAAILQKYEDTNILIEGHTDNTGFEEHNLNLSRLRAQSVANFLAGLKVNPARFTIMGYGESQPIATNDTAEGRQMNRRVDLAVMANEKLKKAAKEKTG